MEPIVVDNIFTQTRLEELTGYFKGLVAQTNLETGRRTIFDSVNNPVLQMLGQELLPLAKTTFNVENLNSIKTTFAHYQGHQGVLMPHIDHHPGVYLLDVCIYEDVPWGIMINGIEYIFPVNSAVAFRSGQLEHWRKPTPDPERNRTGVLLAYFDVVSLDRYSLPVGE